MGYLDAHLAKMRLAEDIQTEDYRRYIEYFDKSQAGQRPEWNRSDHPERAIPPDVHVKQLVDTLRRAETFTISTPMLNLVKATAGDMPSEPLMPQDLPSPDGVLYLPEPFEELDLHGRLLRQHIVTWTLTQYHHVQTDQQRLGVYLNWFTSRSDRQDELNFEMQKVGTIGWDKVGKYMLMGTNIMYFGDQLPKSPDTHIIRAMDSIMPPFWKMEYSVHEETFYDIDPDTGKSVRSMKYVPVRQEGSTITDDQFTLLKVAYSKIADHPIDAHSMKQLVCFWRLCQQTIAAREYARPSKKMSQMMRKRRFAGKPVTVITLRKTRHDHGTNHVEWDHRWLRRGHWRQQWYGSGEDRHQRAIYINPTICGPEDKPLLIRPHVNVLAR